LQLQVLSSSHHPTSLLLDVTNRIVAEVASEISKSPFEISEGVNFSKLFLEKIGLVASL